MKILKTLLPLLFVAPVAWSTVIREKPLVQKFNNSNCGQTSSCDLVEFKLETNEYKVIFSGSAPAFGTDIKMSYRTKKVSQLEDFAIVQFIKGCKFNSYKKPDGKVERYFGITRDFFGDRERFQHKEWVIDSIDKDPMYNNFDGSSRHGAYRSKIQGKDVYFFQKKPVEPELFVTDLPGTASMESPDDIATNTSLIFKSCIFKTRDIPLETIFNDLSFAEPIKCFEWSSSYIYNHDLNKFESKKEIHSFCES